MDPWAGHSVVSLLPFHLQLLGSQLQGIREGFTSWLLLPSLATDLPFDLWSAVLWGSDTVIWNFSMGEEPVTTEGGVFVYGGRSLCI